jgi:hypothetical protein
MAPTASRGGLNMCNAILIGMIFAVGMNVGMNDRPWFWIAYVAAIFFNTNWWQRKERRWFEG